MEYVRVIFPTKRLVYIDGEKSGYTNEVLLVEAGMSATVKAFNEETRLFEGCKKLAARKDAR